MQQFIQNTILAVQLMAVTFVAYGAVLAMKRGIRWLSETATEFALKAVASYANN